jgi:hypothetical protein
VGLQRENPGNTAWAFDRPLLLFHDRGRDDRSMTHFVVEGQNRIGVGTLGLWGIVAGIGCLRMVVWGDIEWGGWVASLLMG